MTRQQRIRHACVALAALATLLVATSADAQRRRMPVRTGEIPDTESGRPAASAANPTFKGRMVIFGPPSLPVTPPPEHVGQPPQEAPAVAKPAPAAAAVIAAPSPAPAPAPAPVITPTTPVAPPIAVPIPAPAPPAPVAAPAPPPSPPTAPVAAPAPVVKPAPAVIAAPPSTPAPPPAVIVAPAAAAKPAPRQDVALAAPSSAAATPAAPVAIEARLIEGIFHCLSPGLPQDWKKAWIEVTDAGAGKEKSSRFFFTNQFGDDEGEPLTPCSAQAITRSIVSLDEKLPPSQRAWTRARLVIDSEGDYELSYDYPK
jgi:hypothetical protein